jgi:xylulokinase
VAIQDWNPVKEIREPRSRAADTYGSLYESYRDLYTSTRDITHHLAERQLR